MKPGTMIAIAGSIVLMVFAYADLGMYLSGPTSPQPMAFLLLMALAALVGALPGLAITWLTAPSRSARK